MTAELPIFVLQVRPSCVPLELEKLPSDTQVRCEYKGVYVRGTSTSKVSEVIKDIQNTIERQSKGFFTLDEAAHVLVELLDNVSPKTMLDSLLDAGRKGKLVVRYVDTQLPVTPSSTQIFPYANVKIDDINEWLETQGVNYRFPNAEIEKSDASIRAETKPISRAAAQMTTILSAIKKLDINPLEIPKNIAGKSGVKATIRKAVSGNNLFTGSTVFDKAWKRMSDAGDIVIKQ